MLCVVLLLIMNNSENDSQNNNSDKSKYIYEVSSNETFSFNLWLLINLFFCNIFHN